MPDHNKFAKLREIGYKVPVTCGLCLHGDFGQGGQWGTCENHKYNHLKHTGPDRGVSIIRGGTCPDAILDQTLAPQLGSHQEFVCRK